MSNHQANYITAVVATAGAIGGAIYLYNKLFKLKLPTQWTKVGSLKNIYAYPVKSCSPVVLETAECSLLGLKDGWLRDRNLMVIDENKNFISARAYPELLMIKPKVRNSILTLECEEMETIHVNLAEVIALQKPEPAKVWGVIVPVLDCGKEVNTWITKVLNKPNATFRLAYYAAQAPRNLRPDARKDFWVFDKHDTGAFPDEVSYNLVNEASVEDLNSRAASKVSHRNFRPNFVMGGGKPYDEDNWKYVKIGDNVFEIIKPCLRCVFTTIDPETGVRNANAEPLETLRKYRSIVDPLHRKAAGTSPKMGLQMALRSAPGGSVSLNDDIYVA